MTNKKKKAEDTAGRKPAVLQDEQDQTPVPAPSASKYASLTPGGRTALLVVLGILLGALITGGIAAGVTAIQTAQKTEQLQTGQAYLEEKVAEHAHTWVPNYATVHHDAVYENVWHEPIYEQQTTYHTVCNDCKKTIDGFATDHITDTGHTGYSTNVPITNEVLKQAGYSEPVLISEGWDETVIEGVTCTGCGETMNAQQAAEAGVSIPESNS